jgi:high affinity choline transporter 7
MESIRWGGVAAVVGMYAVFLFIGRRAARLARDGTATDLILAGRNLPLWLAVMTMTATWVDGGYLNGTAEAAYDPQQGLALAARTGVCFGISLLVGGLFFARTMRRREFHTLVDPFADRFGERWAAVLVLPALLGETIWCGALLVALGETFHVLIGLQELLSYCLSAVIVTAYTMEGGMWSVAWTDAFQLLLIPVGLLAALPFVLHKAGGFDAALANYELSRPGKEGLFPPLTPNDYWSTVDIVSFWEYGLVLVLGGIPWNCYFQRVLACRTPGRAVAHSYLAGVLTILLVIPPLLLGLASVSIFTGDQTLKEPVQTLPLLLRDVVPPVIGLLGLAAIVGAVTSSYSASILSAGSMLAWNVYRPLVAPRTSLSSLKRVIRISIVLVSVAGLLLAVAVGSVFKLWTFTADLVFVLLFPQLVCALFDRKANLIGSVAAFVVSLVLRLGAGEPLFGLPAFLDYPRLLPTALVGDPAMWYEPDSGAMLYPARTLAAVAGMILLPVVSRLTTRWSPPRPLRTHAGQPNDETSLRSA